MLRTLSESSQDVSPSSDHAHENRQLPTPPSEPVSAPATGATVTGLAPTILTTSNVHGLSAEQTQQVLKEKEKEKVCATSCYLII